MGDFKGKGRTVNKNQWQIGVMLRVRVMWLCVLVSEGNVELEKQRVIERV